MEKISDLWVDACEEVWELSRDRYFRNEATLWDAFRFMYMRIINEDKRDGRKVYGEVK